MTYFIAWALCLAIGIALLFWVSEGHPRRHISPLGIVLGILIWPVLVVGAVAIEIRERWQS